MLVVVFGDMEVEVEVEGAMFSISFKRNPASTSEHQTYD
jgi:hypothetical protein